jgi:adenosylmethionine-8-amino-7-oxononanoate aminotransferase
LLAGIDVIAPAAVKSQPAVGEALAAALRSKHLLVRYYGNTLAVGPSLVASESDIDEIVERVTTGTEDWLAGIAA